MRVLVCNLDPAWDFVSWIWRHGVDLYGDADVTLWDISGRGALPALRWPDVLATDALAGRLRDYRESGEAQPELVVLLAGLAAPLDTAHLKALSDLRVDGGKCILLSTPQYWNPVAGKILAPDLFDAVFLSRHQTPLAQYYLFRLMLEILRSPQQASVLAGPGSVLEAEILWRDTGSATDSVVREWPGYVSELLTYYENMLCGEAGAQDARAFEEMVAEYLGGVAALLERPPPETPGTAEDATLPDIDTPLFHQPNLPAMIDRACRRFYHSLRQMLCAWYDRLKSEHDDQTELIQREGDAALLQLEQRAVSIRQALHRDAVRIFKATRKRLADDWVPRVHARLDNDLATMQGSSAPWSSWLHGGREQSSTRGSFVLPWFQEDERLDSSRDTARQSARALAGRNWFLAAPLVVAVIAALPVATRALADGPPLGWLDGAWVAMFMLPLFGSQLCYAIWYRRRLRRHVSALRAAAVGALARHLRALQASYRYLHAREGLRRLSQLDRRCRLYLEELEIDKKEVTRHQAYLKELAEYFRRAGLAKRPANERGQFGMDGLPRTWLATMLEDYVQRSSRDNPQELLIQTSHVTGQGEEFNSRYLGGVEILAIRTAPPAP